MIEVECECGRVIKTRDENAGKKARCPDCGEIVQLPAARKAGGPQPKPVAKATRKSPPADEFDDGEGDEFDDGELAKPRLKSKKAGAKKSAKGGSDAGEPVKKKKKKKGSDENPDLNKNIIIGTCIFFGLAFLAVGGYVISQLPSISAGEKVQVPAEYVDFSTTNGELRCQIPKGWETKSGGGTGGVPPFATMQKGNVTIQFRSSPSGASFQMISQAGDQGEEEEADELKPVSRVHDIQRDKFVQEVSGYEEQGPPEMWKAGFGEVRVSAFTATEGLLGKTFGYRVTILGTNNQWIVTCKCSADQWKDFQPVFRKVVESSSGS